MNEWMILQCAAKAPLSTQLLGCRVKDDHGRRAGRLLCVVDEQAGRSGALLLAFSAQPGAADQTEGRGLFDSSGGRGPFSGGIKRTV